MLIALLEDDESMAALMREWFARAGYTVVHYAAGQPFRRGVAMQAPDLAVIDRLQALDRGHHAARLPLVEERLVDRVHPEVGRHDGQREQQQADQAREVRAE